MRALSSSLPSGTLMGPSVLRLPRQAVAWHDAGGRRAAGRPCAQAPTRMCAADDHQLVPAGVRLETVVDGVQQLACPALGDQAEHLLAGDGGLGLRRLLAAKGCSHEVHVPRQARAAPGEGGLRHGLHAAPSSARVQQVLSLAPAAAGLRAWKKPTLS